MDEVMRVFTLEIEIQLTSELPSDEEFADVSGAADALRKASRTARLIAEDFGGGAARLVFEVKRWREFAQTATAVLRPYIDGGRLITFDVLDGSISLGKFTLDDDLNAVEIPDKLPRRRASRLHDYYAMPLGDDRWAYCQYLARQLPAGDVIRVLDLITTGDLADLQTVVRATNRFWPVFISVSGCVQLCGWKFIGRIVPAGSLHPPPTRYSMAAFAAYLAPGTYSDWRIYEFGDTGDGYRNVGILQDHEMAYEFRHIWLWTELRERIVTGRNPYGDLR